MDSAVALPLETEDPCCERCGRKDPRYVVEDDTGRWTLRVDKRCMWALTGLRGWRLVARIGITW